MPLEIWEGNPWVVCLFALNIKWNGQILTIYTSVPFDNCLHPCHQDLSQDTENWHHSGKCPLTLFWLVPAPAPTQITTVVTSISLDWFLPLPELHLNGIIQSVLCIGLLLLMIFWDSSRGHIHQRFALFHRIVWIYHHLFILSPVEICCLQLLATTNKATRDHSFTDVSVVVFLFLLGNYLRLKLLGHRVGIHYFEEKKKLPSSFPKCWRTFRRTTKQAWGSSCFRSSPALGVVDLLHVNLSSEREVVS